IRGKPGQVVAFKDARRSTYGASEAPGTRADLEGATLTLSLDSGIQFAAERELALTLREQRAKSGSIVLLDPSNGEILAMASAPGFDLNQYGHFPAETRRNHAVADARGGAGAFLQRRHHPRRPALGPPAVVRRRRPVWNREVHRGGSAGRGVRDLPPAFALVLPFERLDLDGPGGLAHRPPAGARRRGGRQRRPARAAAPRDADRPAGRPKRAGSFHCAGPRPLGKDREIHAGHARRRRRER